jgi:phage tail protein X
MGSFEKLGILVIVVIIVMILAVAIHQWGDSVDAAGLTKTELRLVDPAEGGFPVDRDVVPDRDRGGTDDLHAATGDAWPDSTPKRYRIREGDSLWVLVVKKWGLKESFVEALLRANPGLDPARLRVGAELVVPDPAAIGATRVARGDEAGARGASEPKSAGSRLVPYEVQEGDTLESVAKRYLGKTWYFPRIVEANPGLDPNRLRVGQTILVPVG